MVWAWHERDMKDGRIVDGGVDEVDIVSCYARINIVSLAIWYTFLPWWLYLFTLLTGVCGYSSLIFSAISVSCIPKLLLLCSLYIYAYTFSSKPISGYIIAKTLSYHEAPCGDSCDLQHHHPQCGINMRRLASTSPVYEELL